MKPTIIIAEAGVNHNGSMQLAKKMIKVASKFGADYIKFQSFKSELVFSKHTKKADYQKKNTSKNKTALEMGKELELSSKEHLILNNYCKKNKIKYLTTFHDIDSLKEHYKFDIDFIKIGSGDINNLPYLKQVSRINKKIILSTGLSNLEDIKVAIKILTNNKKKKKDITVLHCNSAYPTPLKDANLNVLLTLKKKLNLKIGFSDHTNGTLASIVAASMGACIIEKHFTLNKNFPGPDHKASLNPEEFSEMIRMIRLTEILKGKSLKKPTQSELVNKAFVRKSIVAFKNIKKGEKFNINNIYIKRPSTGTSPMNFFKIIGKRAKKNYEVDDLI